MIGAVLAVISVALFLPILFKYLQFHVVTRIPTVVFCGFIMIAAIQSFFSGLILQTIYQKNRQDFEIELYHVTDQEKEKENAE